ncbi:uroporphyrinogen-III synthase [Alcanivorax hongdengensis A-11-3]|uniref:Uroporphyrinogen-III synthase n=1 Tax=Alcanivorax hongdengensis A-11-3 TaxID=1177179 RepID=L0WH63_9GAMM|nr:uroporphyrinogen-III synthase [Alcanivorax hongdengensis]EKF75457.1 uroporphyrinogen-III synthase [Alcanivorax hongdengensis A-11-3]
MSHTVLITRPQGQHHQLQQQLAGAGYRVVHRPALQIVPLPVTDACRRTLMDLDLFHAVIFISRNAARLALDAMADLWPQWPVGVHWLAVGQATGAELQRRQLTPTLPDKGFNSEALLTLPCLQHLQDKRVLICRGEGGRGLLAEALHGRGATVSSLVFYRRQPATDFYVPDGVDAVMITSIESWQAVADSLPASLLVVAAGERVAAAVRAGHGGPLEVAETAHDEDMVQALQRALP